MTERDRLLRKKQDADELWQLLSGRLKRAQQAQARETRFEEQERIEVLIADARSRLEECESEQRAVEAQLAALASEDLSPSIAPQSGPAPGPASAPASPSLSRSELRRLLESLFATDADLDAFCVDYCAEVQRRFTLGMERSQKHNLLLVHIPEAQLLHLLSQHSPAGVAQGMSAASEPGPGNAARPRRD